MGRGGGCALCPPGKSRRSTRRSRHGGHDDPVQWCGTCNGQVCAKHVTWIDGGWRCTRCVRQGVRDG